jgi:hypothetical protein
MLIAYSRDLRTVDRRLIRAAVRDIGPGYLTDPAVEPHRTRLWLTTALAALLLAAAGYAALFILLDGIGG